MQQKVVLYQTKSGKTPFNEWLTEISDKRTKAAIDARLTRLRIGNFGSSRSVGRNVFELKIDYGPGYRIYFGRGDPQTVVLLLGSTKSGQFKYIRKAQIFWADYKGIRK